MSTMVKRWLTGVGAVALAVLAACSDNESSIGTTASGGSPGTGAFGGTGGAGGTSAGGAAGHGGAAGAGGSADCAVLLFHETFEDGDYLDTLTQADNSGAVKVVSSADGATPYEGDRCLRGNFRIGYTDPITGLAATSRYSGLEIPLGGVHGFRVSVRYRVDTDAQWVMDDGSDTGLGYKFFYLMGTPWDNTLNWVLAQLWGPDHWWFGDNQPNNNTGYEQQAYVTAPQAALGQWHLIELYAALNSAPGSTDGRFRLSIDSAVVIDQADVPWQTATEQTFDILGGVPHMYGGCCGPKYPFGWQIDDLAVWNVPDGCVLP